MTTGQRPNDSPKAPESEATAGAAEGRVLAGGKARASKLAATSTTAIAKRACEGPLGRSTSSIVLHLVCSPLVWPRLRSLGILNVLGEFVNYRRKLGTENVVVVVGRPSRSS